MVRFPYGHPMRFLYFQDISRFPCAFRFPDIWQFPAGGVCGARPVSGLPPTRDPQRLPPEACLHSRHPPPGILPALRILPPRPGNLPARQFLLLLNGGFPCLGARPCTGCQRRPWILPKKKEPPCSKTPSFQTFVRHSSFFPLPDTPRHLGNPCADRHALPVVLRPLLLRRAFPAGGSSLFPFPPGHCHLP